MKADLHMTSGCTSRECICEPYIGTPIGTRGGPPVHTRVAKPLTEIESGDIIQYSTMVVSFCYCSLSVTHKTLEVTSKDLG